MQWDRHSLTAFGGIAALTTGGAMLLEDASAVFVPVIGLVAVSSPWRSPITSRSRSGSTYWKSASFRRSGGGSKTAVLDRRLACDQAGNQGVRTAVAGGGAL